jgi:hypothetical protein
MTRARDLASGLNGKPYAVAIGAVGSVPTTGTTITFPVGRFTQTPRTTVSTGHVTASGAAPGGFAYIPYLGINGGVSVIFAVSAGNPVNIYYTAVQG